MHGIKVDFMKILKLSAYCYPEQVASSHLAKDINEAYEKANIICEIHTPTPCRGIDAETRKKYKKIKYEEINNGHVQIHRYAMYKEPKNSLFRAVRYTLCIIRGFFAGLCAKDIDIYHATSTPPINGFLMVLLKKFKKYVPVFNDKKYSLANIESPCRSSPLLFLVIKPPIITPHTNSMKKIINL